MDPAVEAWWGGKKWGGRARPLLPCGRLAGGRSGARGYVEAGVPSRVAPLEALGRLSESEMGVWCCWKAVRLESGGLELSCPGLPLPSSASRFRRRASLWDSGLLDSAPY